MAITQAMTTSFKQELMEGVHDFTTHTFKIALYTSSATLGATTTAYSATNEVSGTGYTAGGNTLTVTGGAVLKVWVVKSWTPSISSCLKEVVIA